MSVFVVADAHGRLDLVEGLLEKAGAGRGPDRTVVCLGDLCNCVELSVEDDLACLGAAPDLFDVLLVGNHEYPYFGGGGFGGFVRVAEVEEAIRRLEWLPAFAADGFLLSHAGLTADRVAGWETAEKAEYGLNGLWLHSDIRLPIFFDVGRSRGGWDESGGILWSDWSEPKATVFSQIVGHTPGRIRVQGQTAHVKDMKVLGGAEDARFAGGRPVGFDGDEPFAMRLDLGASKGGRNYATASGKPGYPRVDRLAGCWIRDGLVEVVVYEQTEEER